MMFRETLAGAGVLAFTLPITTPASADHPGEDLNQVMAAKEAAFEPVPPRPAPDLAWQDAQGGDLRWDSLEGKIVVVSFVPPGCGAVCADQQDQLSQAITSLNASPMRDMVVFVTIGDAPVAGPGPAANWTRARSGEGQTTETRAAAFALASGREDGLPLIHVLDRSGRQVGIFHGADFLPLNLVLYINGLTNAQPHSEPGLLDRLFGWLR